MKKFYTLGLLLISVLSFGQAPITALNVDYVEDFDGMGATGTVLSSNWSSLRIAGTGTLGAVLTPLVSDGTLNSGAVYNVGTTSATDRAIGVLSSGTTVPAFGISFINNTGNQITEFSLSAFVEQWRAGDNVINESMTFSYSVDATSLNTGTWNVVNSLTANEILTGTILAAAVDGNLPANKSNISSTVNISSTPWLNGSTFWIRWVDVNAAGADSLLAIDDFRFKGTSSVLSNKNFENISGLKVYPNPAKDFLYITSDNNTTKQVEVYDVLGKVVINTKTTNTPVNVANLNRGVYVVKITEEGKTATRKLVIE
jgi:Secretion system C-terminal sorting domain